MRTDRGLLLEIAMAATPSDVWQADGVDGSWSNVAASFWDDYNASRTWTDLLLAQAHEAAGSEDTDLLRANLLLLAGTCLGWLRDIDLSEGEDAA